MSLLLFDHKNKVLANKMIHYSSRLIDFPNRPYNTFFSLACSPKIFSSSSPSASTCSCSLSTCFSQTAVASSSETSRNAAQGKGCCRKNYEGQLLESSL